MEWVALNWYWISPIVIPLIVGGLKYTAKKTSWVWDDKITTILGGWWDMSRGHQPRNLTGKGK